MSVTAINYSHQIKLLITWLRSFSQMFWLNLIGNWGRNTHPGGRPFQLKKHLMEHGKIYKPSNLISFKSIYLYCYLKVALVYFADNSIIIWINMNWYHVTSKHIGSINRFHIFHISIFGPSKFNLLTTDWKTCLF